MLHLPRHPFRALFALAALSPLLLAGCDKPSPAVTLFAGRDSHRIEAACWSAKSSTPVQQSACGSETTEVEIGAGDTIGISVDKSIAEAGWRVQVGENAVTQKTLKDHYFKLPVGAGLGGQSVPLTVLAVDKSGQQVRGVWKFQLVPA